MRQGSSDRAKGPQVVEINWFVNPFRGDQFEELWRPVVEISLEYGAHWHAFWRGQDDPWQFKQIVVFDDKLGFERYWYSEEVVEARTRGAGLFQVPIQPIYLHEVTTGSMVGAGAPG